ncbi:MAG TPA: hypothetical protein VGL23_02555 [Chloroflexota bacterium]|jgi:hypothetical protein
MSERSRVEARASREPSDRDEFVIRLPNVAAWVREQIPDEFFQHMRQARREQLLAMRALIDAALERTERADQRARGRTRTEITVE